MDQVFLAIGVFMAGLVVAGLLEWLCAWWTWRLQRRVRRTDFQRETLFELQDTSNDFIDAMNAYAVTLRSENPHVSVVRRQRDEAWKKLWEVDARLFKLGVRVNDEAIGKTLEALRGFATADYLGDLELAKEGFEASRKLYREAMCATGHVLRTL